MDEDWSDIEVELTIADYFSMLYDELAGKPVNKSAHRRKLLPLLKGRSEGAIEFKRCNISAALIKMGQPFIKGYQPRYNYQKLLDIKVAEFLSEKRAVSERSFTEFADKIIEKIKVPAFDSWLDDAPLKSIINEPAVPYFKPIKINYLEREQRNRSLGNSGEELVIQYEKWRLNKEGKPSLADKIEWISKEKGDGAGFDILSRNSNGTDRYIEVKSTKLSKETPIFFSNTEFEFSKRHANAYWLYRVFNIQSKPKMFQANGSFDHFCNIEPVSYKGMF